MRRYATPLFQHRHYVALALILAECSANTRVRFANALQGTNPNYDRNRFLAACNGTPENWRDNQAKRKATPTMSLPSSRDGLTAEQRVKLTSHSERCIARHAANTPW